MLNPLAIAAGFGGTAPHKSPNPAVWLVMIAAGTLLAAAGAVRLRRPAVVVRVAARKALESQR